MSKPLSGITREILEPVWTRHDIPSARIAKALGVTRQGLSYRAKALGLPSRAGNQACNRRGDTELFRRMWVFGVSTTEMARHFGYKYSACVSVRRRNLGLDPRPRGFRCQPLSAFFEAEMGRKMRADATAGRAR